MLASRETNYFSGLNLVILILIIAVAVFAFVKAFKKEREIRKGFPAEDELSNMIKYKAGYHSFQASLYGPFKIAVYGITDVLKVED